MNLIFYKYLLAMLRRGKPAPYYIRYRIGFFLVFCYVLASLYITVEIFPALCFLPRTLTEPLGRLMHLTVHSCSKIHVGSQWKGDGWINDRGRQGTI
jgi:hypothetical protein